MRAKRGLGWAWKGLESQEEGLEEGEGLGDA